MALRVFEVRQPLYHFVTNLCAVVGGVFAVLGLVDTVLHGALKLRYKREIGKHN